MHSAKCYQTSSTTLPPHCVTPPCKLLLSPLPCLTEGGPLPETPSTNLQGCYWPLSLLGSLIPKALSISPSFFLSCLFLKIKIREEMCCSQQSCWNISQQSWLSQLWKKDKELWGAINILFKLWLFTWWLMVSGADQSVFFSAFVAVITLHWLPKLLASHMDEWLRHTRCNMLYQRAVSVLSLHICGGAASFEMRRETEISTSFQKQGTNSTIVSSLSVKVKIK